MVREDQDWPDLERSEPAIEPAPVRTVWIVRRPIIVSNRVLYPPGTELLSADDVPAGQRDRLVVREVT
jgi:hypothetical protein